MEEAERQAKMIESAESQSHDEKTDTHNIEAFKPIILVSNVSNAMSPSINNQYLLKKDSHVTSFQVVKDNSPCPSRTSSLDRVTPISAEDSNLSQRSDHNFSTNRIIQISSPTDFLNIQEIALNLKKDVSLISNLPKNICTDDQDSSLDSIYISSSQNNGKDNTNDKICERILLDMTPTRNTHFTDGPDLTEYLQTNIIEFGPENIDSIDHLNEESNSNDSEFNKSKSPSNMTKIANIKTIQNTSLLPLPSSNKVITLNKISEKESMESIDIVTFSQGSEPPSKTSIQIPHCIISLVPIGTLISHDGPIKVKLIPDSQASEPKANQSSKAEKIAEKKNSKPQLFTCPVCNMNFTRFGNLTRHKKIHAINHKDERLRCDDCGRKFLQKCDLVRHQHTHQGTEPFRCTVCDKGYLRKSDLNAHLRFHRRERPFVCSHCARGFSQGGDLNRHVRRVHTHSQPLPCPHCPRKLATETTLARHLWTSHQTTGASTPAT